MLAEETTRPFEEGNIAANKCHTKLRSQPFRFFVPASKEKNDMRI